MNLLEFRNVGDVVRAPINSCLNGVVWSPTVGLDRNGCWPSRGSQLPRALPSHKHFLLCCTMNDCRRAARGSLKSVACLFSSPTFLLPVILLHLLMSGNVYPNPGPVIPCSACIPSLFNLIPSANTVLLPYPRLQTSYPPSSHFVSSSSAPSPLSPAPGWLSTFPYSLRVLR